MGIPPENAAHWHTVIVHMPLFALLFSLALLLIAAAMKDGRFQRVALLFMVLVCASVYVVAETGEEAHEIVEHMPGIEENYIHDHEEAAEKVVWAVYGLGALALIILLATIKQKALSGKLLVLMLVATMIAAGGLVWAMKLGGQIHHPETRPGFIVQDDGHEHI